MIDWLNKRYQLLNAEDYLKKLRSKTLLDNDICLSFDDALLCQYDIAVPIMERLGIQSFFFVYSSVFSNQPDPLEIYRLFRTTCYENVDEFYESFFEIVKQLNQKSYINTYQNFTKSNYLSAFEFYSNNDKWFRFLRDQYLNINEYDEIMRKLIISKDFDIEKAKKSLWMTEKQLVKIENKGHIIGLHSFSHPTQISKLNEKDQKSEYERNYNHLSRILKKPINSMSHPCGDYNEKTLKILREMNIEIGFRSNMSLPEIRSPLEIPREDHSNIFRKMHS